MDLSKRTNSEQILPQHREQIDEEIEDVFLWAFKQACYQGKGKTVRETKLNS